MERTMATDTGKRIYKYVLDYKGVDQFPIDVPVGAAPLHVGFDPAGNLAVWALVDPSAPSERVVVTVVGTGQGIRADAGKYFGTFIESLFVFHVFWNSGEGGAVKS